MQNWNIKKFLFVIILACICYGLLNSFAVKFHQQENPTTKPVVITDYVQSIEDNDVVFYLKDYIYSDQTRSGNCEFLVTGLGEEELRQAETNEHRMVGGYRFQFNSASTGHTSLKVVDQGLEVNFQFSSGNDGLGEYDSDAICIYTGMIDEVGRFDLKPNDDNEYFISEGIAVSTTSARIAYDANCKDLQLICDGKKIDVLKNGVNQMLSEYNSEYRTVFFDKPCKEKIVQANYNGKVVDVNETE